MMTHTYKNLFTLFWICLF